MSITKFNHAKPIDWGIDTQNFEFKKLSTLLPNTVYRLRGCFTTKDTGYGEEAVLIMDNEFINIPGRYVDDIKGICSDAETVEQIKAGKAGFKYSTFMSKTHHREGYSVDFVEL